MTVTTYHFIIPQFKEEIIPIKIGNRNTDSIEDIMEEAARVIYYGMAAWEEAWPLRFLMFSESGIPIATAEMFIMSSKPEFSAIIIKLDFNQMKNQYDQYMTK